MGERVSITEAEHPMTNGHVKSLTIDGEIQRSNYRRQLEAVAECNDWTSEKKATSLILANRGKVKEIPTALQ